MEYGLDRLRNELESFEEKKPYKGRQKMMQRMLITEGVRKSYILNCFRKLFPQVNEILSGNYGRFHSLGQNRI